MDWSPTGPAWSPLLRSCTEGVLLEDALSSWQPLKREAGTTTDDPHHPARTLPNNVYTIYGVIASINRYILRLLMQKAQNCPVEDVLVSEEKPEQRRLASGDFKIQSDSAFALRELLPSSSSSSASIWAITPRTSPASGRRPSSITP